jgi:DNA repair protein RecO (recombination protein O)
LAGVAPQVQVCCVTQHSLKPDFTDPDWRVGFSVDAGGTVSLVDKESGVGRLQRPVVATGGRMAQTASSDQTDVHPTPPPRLNTKLDAVELTLLQQLAGADLPQLSKVLPDQPGDKSPLESVDTVWVKVERVLRDYAQYHFGRSIRSAALVDALSIPEP